MAENVYLFLKSNGTDIHGESSQLSLGRENAIECVHFDHRVSAQQAAGSGMATGKRQYDPILIRKRIDKSSPLLAKALCNNEMIEAVFRFYPPNPVGDGTTEQFFTIEISGGRIASFRQYVPDTLVQDSLPPLEEVTFVFHSISWTYSNGGISHEDSWGTGGGRRSSSRRKG
jgi:type VI secretion system secreted protein Hcp